MDKGIKLLNFEKQHLPKQISHCIDEIEKGKATLQDRISMLMSAMRTKRLRSDLNGRLG